MRYIFYWATVALVTLAILQFVSGCATVPPVVAVVPEKPIKTILPQQAWSDFLLKEVKASNLVNLNPKDAKAFCPNGMTSANWAQLIAVMAFYENSSFNPKKEYLEDFGPTSTGLLQISLSSSQQSRYSCGFTKQSDLHDPLKNLACGVKILQALVKGDGVIAGGRDRVDSKGGAKYWSVLREKRSIRLKSGKVITVGKVTEIKAKLKAWCE